MEQPELTPITVACSMKLLSGNDTTEVTASTRKGFIALSSGDLYGRAVNDTSIVGPIAVVAGTYYPMWLRYFGASSTVTILGLA